jgi:hypothetical protein
MLFGRKVPMLLLRSLKLAALRGRWEGLVIGQAASGGGRGVSSPSTRG